MIRRSLRAGVGDCLAAVVFLSPPASGEGAPAPGSEAPTFAADVAPIIERHCVACHRAGGSAPFSLHAYDDVRRRARQIVEVTSSRYMPPWLPSPSPLRFADERRLRNDEIDVLRRWQASGLAAGELDEKKQQPESAAWRLGEPDLVVGMREPYSLPADGTEVFRNFVLSLPPGPRRWVRAVEMRASNPKIVHHAVLTVDPTDASRRLDEASSEPGFDGMQAFVRARSPNGFFVSYTPGKVPYGGDSNMAWELPAEADLVLETHMLPSGRPEPVDIQIAFFFAERRPAQQPVVIRLGSKTIDIAAGEAAYRIEDRLVVPVDLRLLSIYPHAHYLCRSMRATARLPDGRELELLQIESWDFNWQDEYRYAEAIDLPRGTEVRMVYTYDNSAANVRNPHQPPQRVLYGPSSFDEMGDLWLQAVPRSPADLPRLAQLLDRRELAALIASYRKSLTIDPADAQLHFNLGSELIRAGEHAEGVAELQQALVLDARLTAAHINLGSAHAARGDLDRAAASFRQAIALEPNEAHGYFNLANVLAASGDLGTAQQLYDQALALRPEFAGALLNKGISMARLGRADEAQRLYERALDVRPGYVAALYNLALLARQKGDWEAAARHLEAATDGEPAAVPLWMARGEALYSLGSLDAAARCYRRVLELEPGSVDGHANLGLTLAQLGDLREARSHLQKALERQPDHELAARTLEQLSAR